MASDSEGYELCGTIFIAEPFEGVYRSSRAVVRTTPSLTVACLGIGIRRGSILASFPQEFLPIWRVLAEVMPAPCEGRDLSTSPNTRKVARSCGDATQMFLEGMPSCPGIAGARVRKGSYLLGITHGFDSHRAIRRRPAKRRPSAGVGKTRMQANN